MITRPLKGDPAVLEKIVFPVLATPKMDGIRCLKVGGQLKSASFKPIPNRYINKQLTEFGLPDGLDGELMLRGNNFQEVASAVTSRDGEPDFIYKVFDFVSTDLSKPYHLRVREALELDLKHPHLEVLKPVLIKSLEQLLDYEEKCLEEGYEGVMIRHPEGIYKCGRSSVREGYLLKIKRFVDAEAEITGFFQRRKNNNEQERDAFGHAKRSHKKDGYELVEQLGGFSVRDLKTGVEFDIGSGLNDAIRMEAWKDPTSYIGKIITYKSQPVGVKEKPRKPVFKAFRPGFDR